MAERFVRVGTAALIFRGTKVLLGKRKGSHGAGTWSFPGGHVDFGEDPIDSVRREVLEETGIKVGVIERYAPMPWVNTHFPKEGKQYVTLFFTCKDLGEDPTLMEPDKCEQWAWCDVRSLPQPLFEPTSFAELAKTFKDV